MVHGEGCVMGDVTPNDLFHLIAVVLAIFAAIATIDKSVGKGILHKNTAAHKKSHIAQKLNSL